MNKPLLSILIPTVVGREYDLDNLLSSIKKYCVLDVKSELKENHWGYTGVKYDCEEVEVIIAKDDKKNPIGAKREYLYQICSGEYAVQWDDDDDIADGGVAEILSAAKNKPDCITYQERVIMDGVEYKSNHSLCYSGWVGDGSVELSDGFHFWRTPFFKSVIKSAIAKEVPIPHERFGEDNMWADALRPMLATEIHIDKQIYLYNHVSTPFDKRYGFSL